MEKPSPPGTHVILESFFLILEEHWRQLPPEEQALLNGRIRLRTEALLRLGGSWSMLRLREGLRTCIVHSPAQNTVFEQAFDECFGRLSEEQLARDFEGVDSLEAERALLAGQAAPAVERAPAPGTPPPPSPLPEESLGRRGRRFGWGAMALPLGVALAILAGIHFGAFDAPTQPVTTVEGPNGKGDEPAPVDPKNGDPEPKPDEAHTRQQDDDPWIHRVCAGLGALWILGMVGWVYRGFIHPRRQLFLDEALPRQPFTPVSPGREFEPHLTPDEFERLAMAISLTLGAPLRSSIDIQASVHATSRHAGFPTLIPRGERQLRRLLILADVQTRSLQERPLHLELAQGLESRGVPVQLGYWSGTLSRFQDTTSPSASWLTQDFPREGIVLVISDARGGSQWAGELDLLRNFSNAIWIDPRDPAVWGTAAPRIAERVLLIPPTSEGWERLTRELQRAGGPRVLPDAFMNAFRPHLQVHEPGVAPQREKLSVEDMRQVEATLGVALPWACALAALPLPMPAWYAQRIRRALGAWIEGPEGDPLPGMRRVLRQVTHLSIDRICALPGVHVLANGGISFEGPLARCLLQDVMKERWPRFYRRVLELHREALEATRVPPRSLAELERTAALALLQWQLALVGYAQAASGERAVRLEADMLLREAALTLMSLQGTRVHAWSHAFIRETREGSSARGDAFLPSPRSEDIPMRVQPWVKSAMSGRRDWWPWNPIPLAFTVYALLFTWANLLPDGPRRDTASPAPVASAKEGGEPRGDGVPPRPKQPSDSSWPFNPSQTKARSDEEQRKFAVLKQLIHGKLDSLGAVRMGGKGAAVSSGVQIDRINQQRIADLNELLQKINEGTFGSAEEGIQRLAQIEPDNAGIRHDLGIALSRNGSKTEAVKELAEAVKLATNPKADWWYDLGAVQAELGRTDEARKSFQACLKIQPNHRQCLLEKRGSVGQ